MASNEPTGDNAPQEYAQPQDPWEGGLDFPPGQASMPTDPIPHQYDPYSGTYPPQPYTGSGTWVPGTGGQPPTPSNGWVQPTQKPSKTVPILVGVLILVLLGGAGAAAYWYANRDETPGGPTTPTTAPATSSVVQTSAAPATSAVPTEFVPYEVKAGDCVANTGTNKDPKMSVVECTPGVYKVLKTKLGAEVKQDGDEELTDQEARDTCKGSGYTFFYKNNFDGTENDIVFCMTKVEQPK
jgi:flagellar basal body-associated protein FliL